MNNSQKILLHITLWLFIVILFLYVGTSGFNSTDAYLIHFINMSILNITLFYINLNLIIPVTLNKQKYIAWAIACTVIIVSLAAIKYGETYYLKSFTHINIAENGQPKLTISGFWQFIISTIIVNGFFIFLSTVYKFTVDWFYNEKEKRDLENHSLVAELAFLKSQINPHFLFNSLNNIYSLAYQQSASTPYAILKLSDILRYMLYESNDSKVALLTEIEYLKSFIELQKLRFKTNLSVHLNIEGNISKQQIMPLVLISFVENAFKHGVATEVDYPINILISVHENKLLFTISNKKSNHIKDVTGGIGMANVVRRLDLTYPNQYKLNVNSSTMNYYCELFIDL
ncbi:MAG: histidine kinase [Sphingobacteriales bacterium]|nr:MAG: histidine kinase [Sphingobacteriales bacterium]